MTPALWLQCRWWALRSWLRHCPECGRRGYAPDLPKWSVDPVAQMLDVAQQGCRTCGKR